MKQNFFKPSRYGKDKNVKWIAWTYSGKIVPNEVDYLSDEMTGLVDSGGQ